MTFLDGTSPLIYIVRAEFSSDEQEAAWNAWYEEKHIPELLTVPGFRSGVRFQERHHPRRYLAVYEIDSVDVFDEPRYREVTGWREWEPYIVEWNRAVFRVEDDLGSR